MSISIVCGSCQKRLAVKDELAGKRIKCPGCGTVVPVLAAPSPKPASAPAVKTPAMPARPPAAKAAVPAAAMLKSPAKPARPPTKDQDNSPSDGETVGEDGSVSPTRKRGLPNSENASAAKAKPSPKDEDDDDEEADDDGDDWGESVLEEHEVPKGMRKEIRKLLEPGEQVAFVARTRIDVLLESSRIVKTIGMFAICLALVLIGILVAITILTRESIEAKIFLDVVAGLVAAAIMFVGVSMRKMPGRIAANEKTRPTLLIAGRRLFAHPGIGMDLPIPGWMKFVYSKMTAIVGPGSKTIDRPQAYAAADLTRMHRQEDKAREGVGNVVIGVNTIDHSTLFRMMGLDDVQEVERTIRARVLHPALKDLLAGKQSAGDLLQARVHEAPPRDMHHLETGGSGDHTKQFNIHAEICAPERSIAEVIEQEKIGGKVKAPDAELVKKVEPELAAGEKVLWIGEPAEIKGLPKRGDAVPSAPAYELYAITNFRVILWDDPNAEGPSMKVDHDVYRGGPFTQYSATISFKGQSRAEVFQRGPLSYYPLDFTDVCLKEDPKSDGGGSIVFKTVHLKIETVESSQGGGRKVTTVKTTHEVHYFGVLLITNVRGVLRLLYDRLISPWQ